MLIDMHFQVKDLNSDERKVEMEKIQRMFKKAKEFGDEKVSCKKDGKLLNMIFPQSQKLSVSWKFLFEF